MKTENIILEIVSNKNAAMYNQIEFKTILKNKITNEEFFYQYSVNKFRSSKDDSKINVWTESKKDDFTVYTRKTFFKKFLEFVRNERKQVPADFKHFLGDDIKWFKVIVDGKVLMTSKNDDDKVQQLENYKNRFPDFDVKIESYISADLIKVLK
jgi:hypothetical protein